MRACMRVCIHVHMSYISVVDWISPLSILFISSLSIVQCEVGEFMPMWSV